MTAAAAEPLPRTPSLLLVADAWCEAKWMCPHVSDAILDRPANVFVISPALTGRLHSVNATSANSSPHSAFRFRLVQVT